MKKTTSLRAKGKAAIACLAVSAMFLTSCSAMLPVSATSNPVGGSKTGTATATNVLGFWISSDASIAAAAANGGITKISTVDVKRTNFLFVINTYQTTVKGD